MENKMRVKTVQGNWVEGKFGRFEFWAKVYAEPSDFGINGGRVSKLEVGDSFYINYDRGWDCGEEFTNIWVPLVKELEQFAQSQSFIDDLKTAI